jgi:hypothetical protein
MPDHLHVLVEGLTVDADFQGFVRILNSERRSRGNVS